MVSKNLKGDIGGFSKWLNKFKQKWGYEILCLMTFLNLSSLTKEKQKYVI